MLSARSSTLLFAQLVFAGAAAAQPLLVGPTALAPRVLPRLVSI
jgi:hypothetical protein